MKNYVIFILSCREQLTILLLVILSITFLLYVEGILKNI